MDPSYPSYLQEHKEWRLKHNVRRSEYKIMSLMRSGFFSNIKTVEGDLVSDRQPEHNEAYMSGSYYRPGRRIQVGEASEAHR